MLLMARPWPGGRGRRLWLGGTGPARAMGEARPGRPQHRWQGAVVGPRQLFGGGFRTRRRGFSGGPGRRHQGALTCRFSLPVVTARARWEPGVPAVKRTHRGPAPLQDGGLFGPVWSRTPRALRSPRLGTGSAAARPMRWRVRSNFHPHPRDYLTTSTWNSVTFRMSASSTNRRRACMLTVMGSGGS
jgi:hypothetical protein